MDIYVETPRLDGIPPNQPSWLCHGAILYLEAVLNDLNILDPDYHHVGAQRLVLRIWHIVKPARHRGTKAAAGLECLRRGIETAFGKLPKETREQKLFPIETTLELLVRTLAKAKKPQSLCSLQTIHPIVQGYMS